MTFNRILLFKTTVCFLLAFLLSQFTITYVIYPDRPIVQERFNVAVLVASQKTVNAIGDAGKFVISLPGKFGGNKSTDQPTPNSPGGIAFIPPPVINPEYPTPQPVALQPTSLPTEPPVSTNPPNQTAPTIINSYPSPTSASNFPQPTNTPVPVNQPGGQPTNQTIADLVTLLNNERKNNGIASVRFDTSLGNATQARAEDMHTNSYFSHNPPGGKSFAQIAKEFGYNYAKGEVIAAGQSTPAQTLTAWMNSSGHRAILLDSQAVAVGFGMVNNGCGTNLMYRTCWVGITGVK